MFKKMINAVFWQPFMKLKGMRKAGVFIKESEFKVLRVSPREIRYTKFSSI